MRLWLWDGSPTVPKTGTVGRRDSGIERCCSGLHPWKGRRLLARPGCQESPPQATPVGVGRVHEGVVRLSPTHEPQYRDGRQWPATPGLRRDTAVSRPVDSGIEQQVATPGSACLRPVVGGSPQRSHALRPRSGPWRQVVHLLRLDRTEGPPRPAGGGGSAASIAAGRGAPNPSGRDPQKLWKSLLKNASFRWKQCVNAVRFSDLHHRGARPSGPTWAHARTSSSDAAEDAVRSTAASSADRGAVVRDRRRGPGLHP